MMLPNIVLHASASIFSGFMTIFLISIIRNNFDKRKTQKRENLFANFSIAVLILPLIGFTLVCIFFLIKFFQELLNILANL